jgi:hypothetical protein
MRLGKNLVYIFTMRDTLEYYHLVLLINSNADSVIANANFIFVRITRHPLNITDIKRICSRQLLKSNLLCAGSYILRQFGKLF